MPLLVILFLVAACLPVPWPEPSVESIGDWVAGFVLFELLASSLLSLWVSWRPNDARGGTYALWRRRLFLVNLSGTAALIGLGWGWAVYDGCAIEFGGQTLLAPFAELLVPGPYLLVVVANWFVYHPAERALHRVAGRSREPFWSLPAFVFFHARQFLLLVLLPVVLIAAQRAVLQFAPGAASSWWYQLACGGLVLFLFLFLPLLARPMLGLKAFPPGPWRDRLSATADRIGCRAKLLLWPTRSAVMNAFVFGYVPTARFVVFTDRLLEQLDADEVDAVFGHEVGHARHGHLPYYAAFFILSMSAVALALTAVAERVGGPDWDPLAGWGPLAVFGVLAVYLFIAFGFLSRACERQADVAGARAVSCGNPACDGHSEGTKLTNGRGPVCGTGARTMARALEQVMQGIGNNERRWWRRVSAWLKAWQHGPGAVRVEFLHRLAENPALAARHDRFAFRVRLGLVAGLIAVIAVSGSLIGWANVWKML